MVKTLKNYERISEIHNDKWIDDLVQMFKHIWNISKQRTILFFI